MKILPSNIMVFCSALTAICPDISVNFTPAVGAYQRTGCAFRCIMTDSDWEILEYLPKWIIPDFGFCIIRIKQHG